MEQPVHSNVPTIERRSPRTIDFTAFGTLIRALREERGMTVEQVSYMGFPTPFHVGAIEGGVIRFEPFSTAAAIAASLDNAAPLSNEQWELLARAAGLDTVELRDTVDTLRQLHRQEGR
ncbi:MAG: hypothetical protein AMXMBFR58_29750 [Phycisphaerae bacterium]